MNVDTGHLMMLDEGEVAPEGYDLVPLKLQMEAMRKLDGQKETIVDLTLNSRLSVWASEKRASAAKNKSLKGQRKKKITKETKRLNRR